MNLAIIMGTSHIILDSILLLCVIISRDIHNLVKSEVGRPTTVLSFIGKNHFFFNTVKNAGFVLFAVTKLHMVHYV